MTMPLLQVENLTKRYVLGRKGLFGTRKPVENWAVDDVSFSIDAGATLGLVGESGCGKTTTARSILRLVAPTSGTVRLGGREITHTLAGKERAPMLAVRRQVQYVFQDPLLSLNPRWSIGMTLREPLRVHGIGTPKEWPGRIAQLLDLVGLNPHYQYRYPHELSGGQRQRVGIARALAVEPRVLICDEPVSSLDVSVRAQILNLLAELQERLDLAYLYISHDLSSVRFLSTHVAVMYLGKLVEIATADALFAHPHHHYTRALLGSIPIPDPDATQHHAPLPGEVPSAVRRPPGCPFHPRCAAALPRCRTEVPVLTSIEPGHSVSCHNPA